jgi:hypothetical protein
VRGVLACVAAAAAKWNELDRAAGVRSASSTAQKGIVGLGRLFLCGVVMALTGSRRDAVRDIGGFLVLTRA